MEGSEARLEHARSLIELGATLRRAGRRRRSNREIAQALFVTRKTVEKHLGSTYAKLAISTREELADVLGPPHAAIGSRPEA